MFLEPERTGVVLLAALAEKHYSPSRLPGSSCPSRSMAERLRVRRRVILDHHIDISKINTSGRDVCAEEDCW